MSGFPVSDAIRAALVAGSAPTPGTVTALGFVVPDSNKDLASFRDVTVRDLKPESITAVDASLGVTGLAAAQGGAIALVGGTSSTAGNAGGAVTATGGTPGETGVGGAVTLAAGAGGSTSGNGGVASITGGAGTAGDGVGGIGRVVGGAGQGAGAGGAGEARGGLAGATGVGGAVNLVAGAGGATSGKGGAVNATAGAGTAGNGAGGSAIITAGAAHGTGINGGVFLRGAMVFTKMAAPGAGTDQNEVLTAAGMINTVFVHTISTGRTLTTPTGAEISAGCPTDLAVGDSFLFTLITVGTGADDIVTLTAGASGVTLVGAPTVGPNIQATEGLNCWGTWRFRNSAADTWIGYRVG